MVFFRSGTNSRAASCHRVQGEGQWIGPDLSTIGIKYSRDELDPFDPEPERLDRIQLSIAGGGAYRRTGHHGLPLEDTPRSWS